MHIKVVTVTTLIAIVVTLPLLLRRLRPRLQRFMALEIPFRREEILYDTEDLLQ